MGGGGDEAASGAGARPNSRGIQADDILRAPQLLPVSSRSHDSREEGEILHGATTAPELSSETTREDSISLKLDSERDDPLRADAHVPPRPSLGLSPTMNASSITALECNNNYSVPTTLQPSSKETGVTLSTTKDDGRSKHLRRGKWSTEEESYVQQIINDFNNGTLDVPAGTTLRSFLSEKLNCDPMRITKKFTGDACIGKRVFHPIEQNPSNEARVREARETLKLLEERWLAKLEEQKQEAERKSKKPFRHPCGNELRGMSDSEHISRTPVQSETLEWLQEAQKAIKSDVSLEVVEDLLFDGEAICTKLGIAIDADGTTVDQKFTSTTKRRPIRDISYVAFDGQTISHDSLPKRSRESKAEMSSDHAAGGLLVDFLQSLREQSTP